MSNTSTEINQKRLLYLEHGAVEVWTCDMAGRLRFFDSTGEHSASAFVPAFPRAIGV